ncbi:hypothetical protein ACH5RR_034711 [Cinchona calisaya]|uniref:Kinesin motor domain-containing protein n=1 Tax=Cinchona calisaya TaxID=153742 RepID=A0ABD2YF91_9GENT
MENSEVKDTSQCVRVAVNVRPLVTSELLVGCTDCVTIVPGEPQVQIGSHAFTFDYVFGSAGLPSSRIFDECAGPLVDALFHGYNGTVLAYGQTGSGKTYTMGTNYNGEDHKGGVIPKVMETIFSRVEAMKESTEFLIRVSFIEIFKEEVFDLLDANPPAFSKGEWTSVAKPAGPARAPIQIRETVNGGITLAGVTEAEVRTKEEMASFLLRGSVSRATGSTNMNSQSSRSHAIFTISMEQKRMTSCSSGDIHDEFGDEILSAKLHLVDLAGSERAKRTGADGMRLREGIHINKGLLALGNVISALGDDKKRKEGGHVPYRDSKLTRLLQDSLGGNSKTVMIACISPADTNAEETLNTLKYANRARNIQNKAIINRDPMAAQMQRMKNQVEQLQAELVFLRGDSTIPYEELQILKHKISLLEASNAQLQQELQESRISCDHLTQQALDAQVERDRLIMKLESARSGKSWDEVDSDSNQDFDLVKGYISKIQELEGELLRRSRSSNNSRRTELVHYVGLDDSGLHSQDNCFVESEVKAADLSGEFEDEEKEREHSSLQEKLDTELKELDKRLEQKEAEMKRFANVDTSILKQHYDKKVQELELEKRALQKEIEELRHNLANISSTSDDSAQKLKEDYLQKLNVLESQVAELKKKQDAQAQLLRQKQKSDEAAKRLQEEIQRIKTQKVQLQQKIKQESEQFRLWRASREKEVLQLKKEGRRNEYEMHKLLALNQRQKMVLQRKSEEAALATKRLKELLESRKASRELSGVGNSSGPGIQALMQAIEHELEITVRVHEVRAEYERQMEERARMAKEVAELKEEAQTMKQGNLGNCKQTMSPGARNSRIFALENMLATSSSTLVSMASHLSEAEERERAFSGRGRWNQVRSIAEAKNIMNFLFNLASSSRCQLKDREVDCREKDSEIRDLKEKVVKLVRQIELQKADLIRQEKLMMLATNKANGERKNYEEYTANNGAEGRMYDLRPRGSRQSVILNGGGNNLQLLEDMDTSDSENSDVDQADDDYELEDAEWFLTKGRRRRPKQRNIKNSSHSGTACHPISICDSEGLNTTSGGGDSSVNQKSASAMCCCSCSKQSLCKTKKCECRAAQGICGALCGCDLARCSNRESASTPEDTDSPPSEFVELTRTASETDEAERSHILATHGAMLLHSALSEKPVLTNDESAARRKPLSDIGNTLAKPNAPKPNQRKKWRKSTIQLVPAPQPAIEPQNIEGSMKPDISLPEGDTSLKLPRAMRSAFMNHNPLRERNSDPQVDSTVKKDIGATARSPQRQAKTTDEKENRE